ncbi:MAG: winged helix-turn-helix transcriptional regulator [Clostridia bacterium]|nr:winged helix-turn-helix transcriptional regulator [Clostridia bacterium]
MKHSQKHIDSLKSVREKLPKDEVLFELADIFRLFADSTRIKILFALKDEELCVGAICELVGMEQSAVSHQLKILREKCLIKFSQVGKTRLYSLADSHVSDILQMSAEHLSEEA